MRRHHINFLLKFHKPTSRHLYTLRDGGVDLNRELKDLIGIMINSQTFKAAEMVENESLFKLLRNGGIILNSDCRTI